MGKRLELTTLGGVAILLEGEPVQGLASRKADALLVYLAITRRSHAREHLATLLWDDRPLGRSLGNLSVLLNSLKKQLAPFLQIERQNISVQTEMRVQVDIREVRTSLDQWMPKLKTPPSSALDGLNEFIGVLGSIPGGFLDGFHVREARNFEEWVMLERERFQHERIQAHEALVRYFQAMGDFEAGLPHARRILEIDPLQEEIHAALMSMLVRVGKRSEALQQFRRLEELLERELGVGPNPEVKALYERIRISDRTARHNLPPVQEPLFGRESQLAAIRQQLQDPHCRLLTIVGPGGIGKTSLARQLAWRAIEEYLNGAFFVSLASASSPEYLPQYIINALGVKLQGDEEPRDRLFNYLREKELLLVLDNFEHILAGADLISDLLRAAPYLTVVVTSRERLKNSEEWLFQLDGLDVPEDPAEPLEMSDEYRREAETHGALELFMYVIRKVNPGYVLAAEDLPQIIRICRLVEGMPLGIELGATWLRVLPVHEIARRIASDVDFLGAKAQGSLERPQRMQVVFDRSWEMLTAQEQIVFANLSLFKGGFTLAASQQVAGSTVEHLASLGDKSLLRFLDRPSTGRQARYEIHELLRQYAHARLRENDQRYEEGSEAHARFFCRVLYELEGELKRMGQSEALTGIEEDLGNILAAWRWVIVHRRWEEIDQAIHGLFQFYLLRGWFNQGEREIGVAIKHLEQGGGGEASIEWDTEATLARLRGRRGVFRSYLSQHVQAEEDLLQNLAIQREQGNVDELAFALRWLGSAARMATNYREAIRYLEESLTLLKQGDDSTALAETLNALGAVALRQSRYDEAGDYFLESHAIREQLDDKQGVARSLINLGMVAFRRGDYAVAKQRATESLEIGREIGDQWAIAASLNNLGYAEEHLGQYDAARELYQQSLEVKSSIGHRKGMAYSWLNLAMLAYRLGNHDEAIDTNLRAETVLQEIGDRWGLASASQQLGRAYLAQGSLTHAKERFLESLSIGLQIDTRMYVEKSVVGLAELYTTQESFEQAYRLVTAIHLQLAADPEALERAQNLSEILEAKLPAKTKKSLASEIEQGSLQSVAEEILVIGN